MAKKFKPNKAEKISFSSTSDEHGDKATWGKKLETDPNAFDNYKKSKEVDLVGVQARRAEIEKDPTDDFSSEKSSERLGKEIRKRQKTAEENKFIKARAAEKRNPELGA